MKHLDLFSGIGGFSIAADCAGFETIAFSEIDPYASSILKCHWSHIPNLGDIRGIKIGADVITGGDPCQPHSIAGSKRGKEDPRYLWPSMFEIVKLTRPAFVLNENVAGSVSNGVLDTKIDDLESIGYSARAFDIPAYAVGAIHERRRIYLIAADSHCERKLQPQGLIQDERKRTVYGFRWPSRDELVKSIHGLPKRMDDLRCLANAVIPKIPETFMRVIGKSL